MKTERIELARLKLNEANPRQIREEKFGKLVESLLVFPGMMELRPIVHDTDGTILGGNMRYRALLDIAQMGEPAALSRLERVKGWEQRNEAKREDLKSFWGRWFDKPFAYAVKASELTDEEKREFIVNDNAAFGEWDWDALANGWDAADLNTWGVDFPKEWAGEKPHRPDISEDEYGGMADNTDIMTGDIFEIEHDGIKHRLMCGDSCNASDIDKLLDGDLCDMVFTDPPYDLDDSFSDNIFNSIRNDSAVFIMDSDKILAKIVARHIDKFSRFYAVNFKQRRFFANNQPMLMVDIVAQFDIGTPRFNNLFDFFTTLIECSKIHNADVSINFGHSQAKRVELPANFIMHYSQEGDIIGDFFGGAGSTLMAAHQLKRRCYMLEKEPIYIKTILDRFVSSYSNAKITKCK